jgi:hypothetical protein
MKNELVQAFLEGFKGSFRLAHDLAYAVYMVLAAFMKHSRVEIRIAEPIRRHDSRS